MLGSMMFSRCQNHKCFANLFFLKIELIFQNFSIHFEIGLPLTLFCTYNISSNLFLWPFGNRNCGIDLPNLSQCNIIDNRPLVTCSNNLRPQVVRLNRFDCTSIKGYESEGENKSCKGLSKGHKNILSNLEWKYLLAT